MPNPRLHEHGGPGECPKKFWGTLSHKPRWGLTWRGRLLLVMLVVAAGVGWMLSIEPFLSVTDRLDAKILVVEGWVSTYAIRAGAQEFARGNYERVITTGGPVVGSGGYINDYNTCASVGLTGLLREGVP